MLRLFVFLLWLTSPSSAAEFKRELKTDRPTKTEVPFTVEPGRVQLETGLYGYTNEEGTDTHSFGSSGTLKIGIHDRADLEFVADGYNIQSPGSQGIGDVGTRLKVNFFGNDGSGPALGILGFVVFPLAKRDFRQQSFGHGGSLLFNTKTPADTETEINVGFQSRRPAGEDRASELTGSIAVSREIISQLTGYVEFFSNKTITEGGQWGPTFDFGLMQKFGKDVQLDLGANVGLTDEASDINPFLGLSFRI